MKTKILKYLFGTFLVFSITIIALINLIFHLNKSTVFLKPGAGLGNQLFQYSAAYSLAKETNSKLIVLIGSSKKKIYGSKSNDYRHYYLHNFQIKSDDIVFAKDSIKGYFIKHLFKTEFIEKANFILSYFGHKIEFVTERNFFNLLSSPNKTIYVLKDSFESEIFFKKYSEEIKEFLKPTNSNPEKLAPYLEKIKKPGSFCVHIRRGDVSKKENQLFYTPIDYQNKAIELAKKMAQYPYFFIFSDSPEIVKEELNEKNNIEFISNKELSSIDDFILMSSCQNNIITRSTFSWWAAYLNPNSAKIIMAPNPRYSKEWIDSCSNDSIIVEQKRELYTNHAYPESWIKVQFN